MRHSRSVKILLSLSGEQAISETSHKPHEELNSEQNHGSDLVDIRVGLSSEQETNLEPNETLDPKKDQDGDLTNTHSRLYSEQVTSETRRKPNKALNREQVNTYIHQETRPGNRACAVYVRFSDQMTVKPHMLPQHSKFVASRPTVDLKHHTCS